ncbi:MAG: glycerophosphodiester phosphodiesterase family protein, partial [Rhodothermales bacterium]
VETIELDVVVSGDGEVVVSHEPWMSSVICRDPDGAPVREDQERDYNLFEMSYAEIAAFDCGGRGHPSFPDQRPTAASKPLLRDVLRIADGYAMVTGRPLPRYNVEIKSAPENDGFYHPPPDTFARLVYDVLADEDVRDRSTIQSFDVRSVRSVRSIDATQTVALLVNNDDGFEANLRQLGFLPDIYSPNQRLVDAALVEAARAVGMAVVPWTVNAPEDMRRLLDLGVDGLITDYPDRGRDVVDAYLRGRQDN